MSCQFNPASGAALRAVEARQLQQNQAASCAGLKKTRACRNPVPPARVPQGLSRHEGQHFPRLSAITLRKKGKYQMNNYSILENGTLVTDLADHHNTRLLLEEGFEIRHIETYHSHDNDSFIHWEAPEISLENLPF
jgi:hypothetical protein